jgi:hypothetical protein
MTLPSHPRVACRRAKTVEAVRVRRRSRAEARMFPNCPNSRSH